MTKGSTLENAEAIGVEAEATAEAEANAPIVAEMVSESVVSVEGNYYGLIVKVPPHKSKGPAGKMLGGSVKARWIENGKEHVARGNIFVNSI